MRKQSISLVAATCLVTSLSALAAGKAKHAEAMAVTIPSLTGGVNVTAGPLYLQPVSSNLQYSGITIPAEGKAAPAGITTTFNYPQSETVNPLYKWAGLLGIGYVIPHTGNDIQLNWMYLHNVSTDDIIYLGGPTSFTIVTPSLHTHVITSVDSAAAMGKTNYQFNVVDLDAGQYINIGSAMQTRLFAGLRYAQIKNTLADMLSGSTTSAGGLGPPTVTLFNETDTSLSLFNGIGPLFGVDGSYQLGYGLSIVGTVDAALLLGNLLFHQEYTTTAAVVDSGTTITINNIHYDDIDQVVPALDGKLGLGYAFTMQKMAQMQLELGYQISEYFNAIEAANYTTAGLTMITNFGVSGPYLTFSCQI